MTPGTRRSTTSSSASASSRSSTCWRWSRSAPRHACRRSRMRDRQADAACCTTRLQARETIGHRSIGEHARRPAPPRSSRRVCASRSAIDRDVSTATADVYDLIFSNAALHWVDGPRAPARAAARRARAGRTAGVSGAGHHTTMPRIVVADELIADRAVSHGRSAAGTAAAGAGARGLRAAALHALGFARAERAPDRLSSCPGGTRGGGRMDEGHAAHRVRASSAAGPVRRFRRGLPEAAARRGSTTARPFFFPFKRILSAGDRTMLKGNARRHSEEEFSRSASTARCRGTCSSPTSTIRTARSTSRDRPGGGDRQQPRAGIAFRSNIWSAWPSRSPASSTRLALLRFLDPASIFRLDPRRRRLAVPRRRLDRLDRRHAVDDAAERRVLRRRAPSTCRCR